MRSCNDFKGEGGGGGGGKEEAVTPSYHRVVILRLLIKNRTVSISEAFSVTGFADIIMQRCFKISGMLTCLQRIDREAK